MGVWGNLKDLATREELRRRRRLPQEDPMGVFAIFSEVAATLEYMACDRRHNEEVLLGLVFVGKGFCG